MDSNLLNDPYWEYVLVTRLMPYIPAIRRWWSEYSEHEYTGTGIEPIVYDDIECPPGLSVRFTYTGARSPIKNIQAFPFVPTSLLQITGIAGGTSKMVERLCSKRDFKIEEFVLIEKHNLPSTFQQGQFVAFVPEDVLEGLKECGKFVYLTRLEICKLMSLDLPDSVKLKLQKYIS